MKFFRFIPQFFTKIKGLSFHCITLSIICQAFFGILPVSAIDSNVNDFYFQDFTADYYLSRASDGTSRLRVIEQFTAVFPETDQNHGFTRVIPFTNQDGRNLTLPSNQHLDIKVKHNGINETPAKIETNDGYFTVYLGNPDSYIHGRQLYELEYEFINVITTPTNNPNHQELYWDTIGNDWSQPFQNLTARVHLVGDDVQAAFDGPVSCYVGEYGAQNSTQTSIQNSAQTSVQPSSKISTQNSPTCTVIQLEDGVEFYARNLTARENLTFNLQFNPQTFNIPGPTYDYRILIATSVEAVVMLLVFALIFTIHRQTASKREYYQNLFIKPEYTAPSDYTVAEMAQNYIGQKILGSNKVATLLELAVTHKIQLIKLDDHKKPTWKIKVLSTDLTPEQTIVLQILAGSTSKLKPDQEITIKRHRSSNALIKLGQDFSTKVETALISKGLYEKLPKSTKSVNHKTDKKSTSSTHNLCDLLEILIVCWLIVVFIAGMLLLTTIPPYTVSFGGVGLIVLMLLIGISTIISSFAALCYYRKFYRHTPKGLELSKYLDGLRLYLKMAEQDRLKLLQSVKGADTSPKGIVRLYEKLLPYAVIFRLETSWLQTLSQYYTEKDVTPPLWYVGGAAFSAQDFSRSLHSFSTSVNSEIIHSSTSTSSSSASGAGGGGFSGGGGGGGGGGGW